VFHFFKKTSEPPRRRVGSQWSPIHRTPALPKCPRPCLWTHASPVQHACALRPSPSKDLSHKEFHFLHLVNMSESGHVQLAVIRAPLFLRWHHRQGSPWKEELFTVFRCLPSVKDTSKRFGDAPLAQQTLKTNPVIDGPLPDLITAHSSQVLFRAAVLLMGPQLMGGLAGTA
jgi:hypothetical protein